MQPTQTRRPVKRLTGQINGPLCYMEFSSLQGLAQLLAAKGLHQFIVSPGSRCAPLLLALVRQGQINCRTVTDERSAAYMALGLSLGLRQPVGLLCTSGTAVLNYAPAIAEAFYQQVPLVVLTADRPPEWLDQQDGQTLHQRGIFGQHVKASFQLQADFHAHEESLWEANRVVNEAVNLATAPPYGPVHINIPLREPLYPAADFAPAEMAPPRVIQEQHVLPVADKYAMHPWVNAWQQAERKLIVVGQTNHQPDLFNAIYALSHYGQVPVLADVISQQHRIKGSLAHPDLFLGQAGTETLQALKPDLLLTVGAGLISKNIKLFLRRYSPVQHWHLQPAGYAADTFKTMTQLLRYDPARFITSLGENSYFTQPSPQHSAWHQRWQDLGNKAWGYVRDTLGQPGHAEFQMVFDLLQLMPEPCDLHLANSMPVRYANFVSLKQGLDSEVFSNRGTSGIDGCLSTAVGAALARPDRMQLLLTGDSAFLYDRNGLWHNYLPPNLRIVVFNNGGGNIFRMLPGPAAQPELKEYFETRQLQTAEAVARAHGLTYYALPAGQRPNLDFYKQFYAGGAALCELFTDGEHNAAYFQQFKNGFTHLLYAGN